MDKANTNTADNVRCIRWNVATGAQCTGRAHWSNRDCGEHGPKVVKRSRKSTTRRKSTPIPKIGGETEAQHRARARRAGAKVEMNAKQIRDAEDMADQMGMRN